MVDPGIRGPGFFPLSEDVRLNHEVFHKAENMALGTGRPTSYLVVIGSGLHCYIVGFESQRAKAGL
jgi:hypothetical protein